MRNWGFHKRLFLVFIVVTPMFWLLFTEDGKRRSDSLILWMAGGDPIDLNFKVLDRNYTMVEWKRVFSDIDWSCQDQQNDFGDQFCFSEISSYNGIPARYLTAFFNEGHISALKLVYRNQYHQQIGLDLQQQLGRPEQQLPAVAGEGVLQWKTAHGLVVIKAEIASEEEASLMWLGR